MINKKQIILHIGQTKTATTSIQNFLHTNQQQLELSNINYAKRPGRCISHRYLFHLICASIPKLQGSAFCNKHLTILAKLFRDYQFKTIEEYWQYFNDSLYKDNCGISLLSEELLWEIGKFEREFKCEMIKVLANKIDQIIKPEDITILVALRHHAEWIESWHNQMVKDQGNQIKIKPFLESELKLGSLDYAKNLNDWRDIFPKATIKVIDFKASLVTPRPIGIRFLEEANLIDSLNINSIINLVHPQPLQESIHPFLHAYIIRSRPVIKSLNEYKIKIKKANQVITCLVKLMDIDRSYTLIRPSLLEICKESYANERLKDFGVNDLKESINKKSIVPKVLPKEVIDKLALIFKQ